MRKRVVSLLAVATLVSGGLAAVSPPVQGAPKTPAGVVLERTPTRGTKVPAGDAKGLPPVKGQVSAQVTVTCPGAGCYNYAIAEQGSITGSDGAQVTMDIRKPGFLNYDHHSLADHSLSGDGDSDGQRDVIEAGWTVDPVLNGDSDPHLFVYYWVDGTPAGSYNSGMTLAVGRPKSPGDLLTSGTSMTLKWQHFGAGCGCTAGWWLSYGGSYVGVFPDTLWTGNFTSYDRVQDFGEVLIDVDPSATDMGTGTLVAASQATMSGYTLFGGSPPTAAYSSFTNSPSAYADRWPITSLSTTSFRYGGPGGNETRDGGASGADADDCPGVGTGSAPTGQGAFCTYNGFSSGRPQTKVTQIDGGAAATTCRANQGTADGGGLAAINYLHLGLYRKINWFRDASCAGAAQIYSFGDVTLPAGWNNLAHASFSIRTDKSTCATNYPTVAQTC